jgi:hypothetical protein
MFRKSKTNFSMALFQGFELRPLDVFAANPTASIVPETIVRLALKRCATYLIFSHLTHFQARVLESGIL